MKSTREKRAKQADSAEASPVATMVIAMGAGAAAVALALAGSAQLAVAVPGLAAAVLALLVAMQLRRTSAKQGEAEQRAAAMAATVERAYDAFVTMDGEGVVRGWNAQAESIFGWPRDEAIGTDLADLIVPPQHRTAHREGLMHFLQTGDGPVLNKRIEITAWHRVGREFPVELAIWSAPSADGSAAFNAFIHDISERKRNDDDRAELANNLKLLLQTSGEGIFEVDIAGRWTFINAAAATQLGVDPTQAIGMDACEIIHRSALVPNHDHNTCVIRYVLHSGERARYEQDCFYRPDGSSFPAECRTHPTVFGGAVHGAVVVFTERTTVGQLDDLVGIAGGSVPDTSDG